MGGRGGRGSGGGGTPVKGRGAGVALANRGAGVSGGGVGGGGGGSAFGGGAGGAGTGGIQTGVGNGSGGSGGSFNPLLPTDLAKKRGEFNRISIEAQKTFAPPKEKSDAKRAALLSEVSSKWNTIDANHAAAIKLAMDDALVKAISEGELTHRTNYLDDILNAGNIRSLFETSTSSGGDSEHQRAFYEDAWFGQGKVPPVYSAIELNGVESSANSVYGKTVIYFKDEVKDRITVTLSDSLMASSDVFPGKQGDGITLWAAPSMFTGSVDQLATREANAQAAYAVLLDVANTDTFEAQIHGGVVVEDISRVVFKSTPDTAMTDKLDALGIPWEVYL